MSLIIKEYLGLFCKLCGAASAGLSILIERGGETRPVLELTASETDCSADRTKEAFNPHLPLIRDPAGSDGCAAGIGYPGDVAGRTEVLRDDGWSVRFMEGGAHWAIEGESAGYRMVLRLRFGPGIPPTGSALRRCREILPLLPMIVERCGFVVDAGDGAETPGQQGVAARVFDPPLVGRSKALTRLKEDLSRVAESDIALLVEGESGTGKEILACNAHRLSRRRRRPLVIVNCMELTRSLLQSELFGHVKGAFTGASCDRAGLIESAAGGSFFLDEVGELPLSMQAALLRVLQEREVRRIGESNRRRVDVRFIFATNRSLGELMSRGRFRRDLFYRINGVTLHIPPLRDRVEDILPLATYFLTIGAARRKGRVPALSACAARLLCGYPWPGNVRELKNEMERVTALYPGARSVTGGMLSGTLRDGGAAARSDEAGTMPAAVRMLEQRMMAEALDRTGGNRTRAAAALGITRQGLLKKLKRYGM